MRKKKYPKLILCVAYIIEDHGFRIVCLKNRTITVFNLHVGQNVVFRRSSRTHVFLGVYLLGVSTYCFCLRPTSIASWVSCRYFFALAFWESYRGKGGR